MFDLPDYVNAAFEILGAVAIAGHVRRVLKDKAVAGVSIASTIFFASWGFWNLYYYPHLGQWASFTGGIAIVVGNVCWITGLIYYTRHPKTATFSPNENDTPLIRAYKEYIELIGDEVEDLTAVANIHGMKSTRIEAGQRCRDKIARLEA
jgi:predicted membrane channel-forming protein YqfA (hemolysin III family)